MNTVLWILLGILGVKFALNFCKYIQCRQYLKKYNGYLKESHSWKFMRDKPQIVKLFQNAGIQDSFVAVVQPVGLGYISNSNVSVFANLQNKRQDIVSLTLGMFHQALGIYRTRMIEAFNPLYWLEFIIYLPKTILNYLDVSPESAFVKVTQIIYWLLTVILGVVYGLFKTEVDQFMMDWILKFFS